MDMTTGLLHPKTKPGALDRADRQATRATKDRKENDKVKARSEGQCEVVDNLACWTKLFARCWRRATQVHHMISGRGKRAIGASLLAEHKQHICNSCHADITERRLKRIATDGQLPRWTDQYRRVR